MNAYAVVKDVKADLSSPSETIHIKLTPKGHLDTTSDVNDALLFVKEQDAERFIARITPQPESPDGLGSFASRNVVYRHVEDERR